MLMSLRTHTHTQNHRVVFWHLRHLMLVIAMSFVSVLISPLLLNLTSVFSSGLQLRITSLTVRNVALPSDILVQAQF